jgi:hypothetical protein
MADPITASIGIFVGGAVAVARRRHQDNRRVKRICKAQMIIVQLANHNCDMEHFHQLCMRYNGWSDPVIREYEICNLSPDPIVQENARYLMGLYGRSETTRTFIMNAAELGAPEIIRMNEAAAAIRENRTALVEAGFDLVELLRIAEEARANGWSEEQILEATRILWGNDREKEALAGLAMDLISQVIQNEMWGEVIQQGIAGGAEAVGEGLGEMFAAFFSS